MDKSSYRDYIEGVRQATDIVAVASSRVALNGSSKGLCPFHEDHTPSFSVNVREQYFHCFGCGVGGDVFTFVQLTEGVSFPRAVELLAQRAGLPGHLASEESRVQYEAARRKSEIITAAARYYQSKLTPEARAYLMERRGLPSQIVEQFGLGWADGTLRDHLLDQRGYQESDCLAAGVLSRGVDGRVRDFLYHRITFPVWWRGITVHLTGRTIEDRDPKYLHLPGTIEHLYNEEALDEPVAYVTEGPISALSLAAWGYPAVALLGASRAGAMEAERFERSREVYLCLDGDAAGAKGRLDLGCRLGSKARIVTLPPGEDPNDLLRRNAKEEFEGLLRDAVDPVTFQIGQIPADVPKTVLLAKLEPVLDEIAGMQPPDAEAFLALIRQRFGLHREDLQAYRAVVKQKHKVLAQASHSVSDTDSETKPTPTAVLPGLVDIVEADGRPAFLMKEGSGLVVRDADEADGVLYVPPSREQLPWLLARADEVLRHFASDTDARLYDDLLDYHRGISELPGGGYYHLIAAWDIHTYLLEDAQYSPVIWLYAVPERGKTRTGKGMTYVSYRGLHVESLRDAYLIRVAQDLRATLFIDVMDIWKKAEREGSEDVLLLRYEKGAKVPRVIYPDRGPHRDTVYYSIFGPTIIGTNEPIHQILETRSVPVTLPQSGRQFEVDLTPEDGRPFRERLLALRARHLGNPLPDVDKPARGRLGDILKPLLQVTLLVRPDHEHTLRSLFQDLEGARLAQKSDSLESKILVAVSELEDQVEHGILAVKEITDHLNAGKPEKERLSYQRVGRRLDALGFKKRKTGDNRSAIAWDAEHLARAMSAYGLGETPETPETPNPLSESDLQPGVSGEILQMPSGNAGEPPEERRVATHCYDKESGVSGVSGVSSAVSGDAVRARGFGLAGLAAEDLEAIEERAAIMEYEGGLSRDVAEVGDGDVAGQGGGVAR